MENSRKNSVADYARITGFIAVALVLSVLAVPTGIAVFRPDFIALALIYLAVYHPHRVGVFTAFAAGLLVDVITFGTLGQHAIAKVVIVYLVFKLVHNAQSSSLRMQSFLVFILLVVNAAFIFAVHFIVHSNAGSFAIWLAPVSGSIVWAVSIYFRNRIEIYRHGSLG